VDAEMADITFFLQGLPKLNRILTVIKLADVNPIKYAFTRNLSGFPINDISFFF